jgi:hypothetical protein
MCFGKPCGQGQPGSQVPDSNGLQIRTPLSQIVLVSGSSDRPVQTATFPAAVPDKVDVDRAVTASSWVHRCLSPRVLRAHKSLGPWAYTWVPGLTTRLFQYGVIP